MKVSWKKAFVAILALLLAFGVGGTRPSTGESTRLVAAAVALQPLMEKILPQYNEDHDLSFQGVYGTSGNLARQIESGAPFDLFLSADEQWARYAEEKGLLDGVPLPFATMPLVLWHSGMNEPSLDLLNSEKVTVAIANPETAPFGRRAKAYLVEKNLYEALEKSGRLLLGGDVLKTGLIAKSGAAHLAILPLSTALALGSGRWTELDAPPQTLFGGIVKDRSTPSLEAFWAFLRSPEAEPFLKEFGFLPPR